ncbi:unnamed protein product [Boreogadus saida]
MPTSVEGPEGHVPQGETQGGGRKEEWVSSRPVEDLDVLCNPVFLGPFVTPRETSSNMVLGVEEDGIAEYPVEYQGSEAAAGTASDLGDLSCEVLEAAAASEPIPPPPTAAAVTTPPLAPGEFNPSMRWPAISFPGENRGQQKGSKTAQDCHSYLITKYKLT